MFYTVVLYDIIAVLGFFTSQQYIADRRPHSHNPPVLKASALPSRTTSLIEVKSRPRPSTTSRATPMMAKELHGLPPPPQPSQTCTSTSTTTSSKGETSNDLIQWTTANSGAQKDWLDALYDQSMQPPPRRSVIHPQAKTSGDQNIPPPPPRTVLPPQRNQVVSSLLSPVHNPVPALTYQPHSLTFNTNRGMNRSMPFCDNGTCSNYFQA